MDNMLSTPQLSKSEASEFCCYAVVTSVAVRVWMVELRKLWRHFICCYFWYFKSSTLSPPHVSCAALQKKCIHLHHQSWAERHLNTDTLFVRHFHRIIEQITRLTAQLIVTIRQLLQWCLEEKVVDTTWNITPTYFRNVWLFIFTLIPQPHFHLFDFWLWGKTNLFVQIPQR